MLINVIVPTLGTRKLELKRLFDSLKNQNYKNFKVIIVSQDNHDVVAGLLSEYSFHYTHLQISQRGTSNAKNEGIKHIDGDIVSFPDDDCWYPEDAFSMVVSNFNDEKNRDILCFKIYDPNTKQYYKNYDKHKIGKITWKNLFNKSQIEVFINMRTVKKEHLHYDPQFGVGAMYPSGEENIFLHDLYKHGYKVFYEPKTIVYHKKPEIQTRINKGTFIAKGPLFKRMFSTPVAIILFSLFFINKFRLLDKPFVYYFKGLQKLMQYDK